MGTRFEKSLDIEQPVRTVYDQWTQFEDFPFFMEDVEDVVQENEDTVVFHFKAGGADREWRAQITEQIPDKRIAWTTVDGPQHAGVVTFHHLREDLTRIMVMIDYEPSGFLEHLAEKTGRIDSYIENEMNNFKAFIEKRGKATGSYRGEIDVHDEPWTGTEGEADVEEASTDTGSSSDGERRSAADDDRHKAVDHREAS